MTAFFKLLGVDYVQWKAVSRTLLRGDFRMPMAQSGEAYSLQTIRGLAMMALVHGLVGVACAIVVFLTPNVSLTGTIVLSYHMFVLATTLLTQHGVTLLTATDYLILGPRPVTSRTFLAIRLTNVLFHALLITTFIGVPAIVAYGIAHEPSVARALAAAVAIYAWAVALTLALSASYGALLRFVGAVRLQRVLGYMQLIVGLLMYGGIMLSSRLLGRGALEGARIEEPWPWFIPPAWFASLLEVASGAPSAAAWGRMALALASIVLMLLALRGRLGLDYASRLAEVATASSRLDVDQGRASNRRALVDAWLFRTGEARAAAVLVLAHFKHDMRVRMGVMGVLPLIVFYLLLGSDEAAADPFVTNSQQSTDFIALAVLLFPAILTQHFSSSEAYQASWIFSVTTADPVKLVIGLKNAAVAYFLLPFLCLVAALYTWRFGHVGHALTHTAILGLIGHLALQGSVAIGGHLPFSQPPEKLRGGASMLGWMMFVIFGGQLLLWALPRFIYASWTNVVIMTATLLMATQALNHAIALRVRQSQLTRCGR